MIQLTVHCYPLIDVLALRQLHGVPEVARPQRRRRMLHQVILMCSLGDVLLRLEGLVRSVAVANQQERGKC